jgi:hypothetical protein
LESPAPWRAAALIAEAALNPARAFFRAGKEVKAQAVALAFALARSMEEDDAPGEAPQGPPPPPPPPPPPSARRRARLRASADEEAGRNPSVTPVLFERAAKPGTGRPPVGAAALLTLRRILDLCADPQAARAAAGAADDQGGFFAPRRGDEAFAAQAWANARSNRQARRALDLSWRGRRRARRQTG